jgi:hypothetical protein
MANLGKLQSAGMLTHWRFWRFSDTIKWLLSWGKHGRLKSSWAGALTPSRGAYLFIGLILHQMGERAIGWVGAGGFSVECC